MHAHQSVSNAGYALIVQLASYAQLDTQEQPALLAALGIIIVVVVSAALAL
jgi:hypothetical protein